MKSKDLQKLVLPKYDNGEDFSGISMVPSVFQRSSGGAEKSVKSVLSI